MDSNQLTEYFNNLAWDGMPRLDTWLTEAFGAENTPEVQAIGAKWFIGAVARWFQPGCRMDGLLAIHVAPTKAKQAKRAFEVLCPGDNLLHNDDVARVDAKNPEGYWPLIWLLPESIPLTKAKNLITRTSDTYRSWYNTKGEQPRRCVLAMIVTQGSAMWAGLPVKSRRFWQVKTSGAQLAELLVMRDQLWAEAVHRYRAGESWWMTEESPENSAQVL